MPTIRHQFLHWRTLSIQRSVKCIEETRVPNEKKGKTEKALVEKGSGNIEEKKKVGEKANTQT